MEYIALRVVCKEDSTENREIVTALLGEFNFTMFEDQEDAVVAFATAASITEENITEAKLLVSDFAKDFEIQQLKKENWNEIWEKNYFSPVEINNFVRISAPFHPATSSQFEFEIVIQPKMSFGTGNHATTDGMMQLMQQNRSSFVGAQVLDMGSGTGILGILAGKLEAKHIVCIDIEDWAAENCLENFHENGLTNVTSLCGDAALLEQYQAGFFDIILANIQKTVLLADMESYCGVLANNGHIYFSGFYEEDLVDIKAKAASLGLSLSNHIVQNRWCAAVFQKKPI